MAVDQQTYQAENEFGFWVQFKLVWFAPLKMISNMQWHSQRIVFMKKKNPNAFCFLKSIRKKWGSECELEVSCHVQVRLRKRPSRNSKFGWQTFPWIIEVLMAENYSGTKGSWLFNDETTFTRYNFFTWHAQPN